MVSHRKWNQGLFAVGGECWTSTHFVAHQDSTLTTTTDAACAMAECSNPTTIKYVADMMRLTTKLSHNATNAAE